MERVVMGLFALMWILLPGCAITPQSDFEPIQVKHFHSRDIGLELSANYEEVWWGTVSALTNEGFILRQADKNAGFVYGVWTNTVQANAEIPFLDIPLGYSQVEVSITLERRKENHTIVRVCAAYGSGGESQDDAQFQQKFFAAVQREVFLRVAARELEAMHDGQSAATTRPAAS